MIYLVRVALTHSLRDQRIQVSNGGKQATANGRMIKRILASVDPVP